eukprot:707366-Hanusia_phi.AAC.4
MATRLLQSRSDEDRSSLVLPLILPHLRHLSSPSSLLLPLLSSPSSFLLPLLSSPSSFSSPPPSVLLLLFLLLSHYTLPRHPQGVHSGRCSGQACQGGLSRRQLGLPPSLRFHRLLFRSLRVGAYRRGYVRSAPLFPSPRLFLFFPCPLLFLIFPAVGKGVRSFRTIPDIISLKEAATDFTVCRQERPERKEGERERARKREGREREEVTGRCRPAGNGRTQRMSTRSIGRCGSMASRSSW